MQQANLKGSTLIETIVAMVLLLICFFISIAVFNNILLSENNRLKLSADLALKDVSLNASKNKYFIDEEISYGPLKIRKRIKNYNSISNLAIMELVAFDLTNRIIGKREDLILIK